VGKANWPEREYRALPTEYQNRTAILTTEAQRHGEKQLLIVDFLIVE
jgi:hypothetical protein